MVARCRSQDHSVFSHNNNAFISHKIECESIDMTVKTIEERTGGVAIMMRMHAQRQLTQRASNGHLGGIVIDISKFNTAGRPRPVAQSAPRNLLTRWDVSSIPANGIFLTKN